jgi:hypothetical protein
MRRFILSVILGASALALLVLAQTSNYPAALDTASTLYLTADNVQTSLTSPMLSTDTVAIVASSTGFTANMIATICDSVSPSNSTLCTEWEHMLVTNVAGNVLTVTRGVAGTTAVAHASGKYVSVLIDAAHQQVLKSAILSIESALGPNLVNVPKSAELMTSQYNFAAQTPGGTLSAGACNFSLAGPQPGVVTGDTLYISGGTGTPEALTAASVVGTTVAGTCAYSHSGAWTVQSATSGVQEAIGAAPAAGGWVVVPAGTWPTYGAITLNGRNNIHLAGAPGVSTLAPQFTSGDVIHIIGTGQYGTGTWDTVTGLLISPQTAPNTLTGVHVSGAWYTTVDLNSIINVQTGLTFDNNSTYMAGALWATRNAILGMAPSTGIGIAVNTAQDVFIDHNIISGGGNTPFAGIAIYQNLAGTKITFNDVFSSNIGLIIAPGAGQTVQGVESTSNWYDTNQSNAVVIAPNTGAVEVVRFNQDWMNSSGGTGRGFWVGGTGTVDDLSLSQCDVEHNGGNGIELDNTSLTHARFVNLTVGGNSVTSPGLASGMVVAANVSNWQVIGGRYGPTATNTAVQANGISILAGASDYYMIVDADTRGNSATQIADAGTGTHKVIRDNLGYNPVGISIISCTTGSACPATASGSPSILYILGGTFTGVTRGGATVCTASPCTVFLAPGQQAIPTFSGSPTFTLDVQ